MHQPERLGRVALYLRRNPVILGWFLGAITAVPTYTLITETLLGDGWHQAIKFVLGIFGGFVSAFVVMLLGTTLTLRLTEYLERLRIKRGLPPVESYEEAQATRESERRSEAYSRDYERFSDRSETEQRFAIYQMLKQQEERALARAARLYDLPSVLAVYGLAAWAAYTIWKSL